MPPAPPPWPGMPTLVPAWPQPELKIKGAFKVFVNSLLFLVIYCAIHILVYFVYIFIFGCPYPVILKKNALLIVICMCINIYMLLAYFI